MAELVAADSVDDGAVGRIHLFVGVDVAVAEGVWAGIAFSPEDVDDGFNQ